MDPQSWALLLTVLAFAFGAIFGSFLNVCIFRLPRQCLSLIRPLFSICPSCRNPVRAYDNLPIVSYLLLAGKCRDCKAEIPVRYFVVELLTAFLFALVAWYDLARPIELGGFPVGPDLPLFAVHVVVIAALIVCAFVDIDLRIIPDEIDKPGMLIAPILSFLVPTTMATWPRLHPEPPALDKLLAFVLSEESVVSFAESAWFPNCQGLFASLLGVATGASLIFVVAWLGEIIFRQEAMGLGDVKFMGMIGGFVGWDGVLVGFMLACIFGSVIGLLRRVFVKDAHIWFGPFLALGAFLMFLYRDAVLTLLARLVR